MQTKLTYFGQHFHLSIVSGDKNPTLILSNTDETRNQVVPVDYYELKEVSDFINRYLEQNVDKYR
jgi:hypothetical protein